MDDDDLLAEIMSGGDINIGRLLPGDDAPLYSPPEENLEPELPNVLNILNSEKVPKASSRRASRPRSTRPSKNQEATADSFFNGSTSPPLKLKMKSESSLSKQKGSDSRIKIYLRRLDKKRCEILRVEGLTQDEVKSFSRSGKKQPSGLVMPPLEQADNLDSIIRSELENFDVKVFHLKPTPSVKLVTDRGRKNLDNLSLADLSNAMQELQDVLKSAKQRGFQIREKLLKIQPNIRNDKVFQTSAQLLDIINEVDIKDTVEKAMDCDRIEQEIKLQAKQKDVDVIEVNAENQSNHLEEGDNDLMPMEEEKAQTKKRDKRKQTRTTFTPKTLWEAWDTYWKFPSSQITSQILRHRPTPPYSEGNKPDPHFEVPELGPHYTMTEQAKQEYKTAFSKKGAKGWISDSTESRNVSSSLRKRLVCGLLFGDEMSMKEKVKRDKQPKMTPAIRAVLSGLRGDDFEDEEFTVSRNVPKPPKLSALELTKSKAKTAPEERAVQELNTIDVLGSENVVWKSLALRRDSDLYVSLRDQQVRLYNEVQKNNKWRRQIAELVSKACVPLTVERDLAKLQASYSELAKAYRAYKKKGFDATSVQVVKALSNLNHVRDTVGSRASLTGVEVNPVTVGGIPRYELDDHLGALERRREEFRKSHKPINLDNELHGGLKNAQNNKHNEPEKKPIIKSRTNVAGVSEYQPTDQIFSFDYDEDDEEEDEDEDEYDTMD